LKNIEKEELIDYNNNLLNKERIEKITLNFDLKMTNIVVHGSITSKQILKSLHDLKIEINKYQLGHVQINSLGLHKIEINLSKKVKAILKVEIGKNE
jgi:large subunit ribosomal protein L9